MCLGAARETRNPETDLSTYNLVEAQVHATLALVEQQRIANLIALWVNDAADISDARFDSVSDEIHEALGLRE